MNITRAMLMDLLPLYLGDECSADTRALIEAFIKQDPDFARTVDQERSRTMLESVPITLSPDLEKRSMDSTRALLRRRTFLLAFACFSSALPFSIAGDSSHGITWMMWRDFPVGALVVAILSVACWIAYAATHHRVKSSGL